MFTTLCPWMPRSSWLHCGGLPRDSSRHATTRNAAPMLAVHPGIRPGPVFGAGLGADPYATCGRARGARCRTEQAAT
jgi:hypothetical protein